MVATRASALWGRGSAVSFVTKPNSADLAGLGAQIERGDVRPVVERTYPLAETADALRYLGTGHARGKLVVAVA